MYKLECSVSVGCTISKGLKNCEFNYYVNPKFEDELNQIKDAGITAIELYFGAGVYARGEKIIKNFKKALKIVKKSGLRLNSIHFPFGPAWADLACPYEEDRVEIVKWFGKMFKISNKLRPVAYVFHPGADNIKEEQRELCMSQLVKTVDELSTYTDSYVCVENMVGGILLNTLDKILDYAQRTKKGYVILDVNHLLQDKPQDAILALGDKLKSLHISDHDFVYEKHWLPTEGKIEWQEVIKALEKIGYSNCFTYEVNGCYSYKTIKENYERLFNEYNK